MSRRKSLAYGLLLCVLGLVGCGGATGGSYAPVDIPALKVVPDNALAVVVIKNLSELDAKSAQIGQALQLPAPPMLATAKAMLNIKDGLDEKGTFVMALVPDEHMPAPMLFVPVTDYEKFVAQLSPEKAGDFTKIQTGPKKSLVAKKGNYAVITEGSSDDALKAVIGAKGNISSELAPASGWIADQDIAAVATTAGIKMAVGPARQGLEMVKKSIPKDNPQAENVMAAFGMYEILLKSCEEDVTQAGIGLKADKDSNIHITSHWGFKTGSSPAKALAGVKALSQKPLADLPAGPFVIAMTGVAPENIAQWMSSMIKFNPQLSGLSDEQRRKMETTMNDFMKGMESMSWVLGVPGANDGLFRNSVATMRVENSAKFMETMAAKMQDMKQVYQAAKIPGADSYAVKAIDIGGAKAVEFTMDLTASLPPSADENAKRVIEAMTGPGGKMTVTYVAADDKTILATYTGGDEAKKQIAAYKTRSGSLASDAQTAKTLALLPHGAQWVGVWDVPGTLTLVKQVMGKVAPDGPAGMIPTLPAMPPLGFAATASAQGVDTDLVLPVDTLKSVSKAAMALKGPGPQDRP